MLSHHVDDPYSPSGSRPVSVITAESPSLRLSLLNQSEPYRRIFAIIHFLIISLLFFTADDHISLNTSHLWSFILFLAFLFPIPIFPLFFPIPISFFCYSQSCTIVKTCPTGSPEEVRRGPSPGRRAGWAGGSVGVPIQSFENRQDYFVAAFCSTKRSCIDKKTC